MNTHPHGHNDHILVMRFSALGDVAMTLPVIYSVARQWPQLKITVVTRPFFSRLFINAPVNVAVEAIEPRDYRGATGLWRMLKRLSRLKPTAVADLHNVGRTWAADVWFRLHGIRVVKVDKMRCSRHKVLRQHLSQKPFIERYVDVFAHLGYPASLTFTSIFADIPARAPVPVTQPAVGVAPFARYDNKMYPPEMMRRVAEMLAAQGVRVYLFAGRGHEAKEMDWWAREIPGCESVAGRFDIAEEMAMMSKMKLMVSMDSANQHLASLVGTPVLTLWGSTSPACGFMAYRQSPHLQLLSGIDCQPCTIAGSKVCHRGDMACMRKLTEKTVVDRIISFISTAHPHADA